MKPELVEAIAQQLHKEYRAAHKALSESKHRHDHGWTFCHNKNYFLKRAERMLPLLAANGLLLDPPMIERAIASVLKDTTAKFYKDQWLQARGLLQRVINGCCKESRTQAQHIEKLKQDLSRLNKMLEAATAAGITFDGVPETGEITARNKLVEKRPTRIIKLPSTDFYTMKITKLPASESVADATGDSKC